MQTGKVVLSRVIKDIAELHSPEGGIYVKVLNDNYELFYVMLVGAEQTPYAGTLLFFTVEPGVCWLHGKNSPTKYPFNSPRVLFYSGYRGYVHTNLYMPQNGGKVCLSILYGTTDKNEAWAPTMTFNSIFQSVFGILDIETKDSFYTGAKFYATPWEIKCTMTRDVIHDIILPVLENRSQPIGIAWQDTVPHNFGQIFAEEIKEVYCKQYDRYLRRVREIESYLKAQGFKQKKPPKEVVLTSVHGTTYSIDTEAMLAVLQKYPPEKVKADAGKPEEKKSEKVEKKEEKKEKEEPAQAAQTSKPAKPAAKVAKATKATKVTKVAELDELEAAAELEAEEDEPVEPVPKAPAKPNKPTKPKAEPKTEPKNEPKAEPKLKAASKAKAVKAAKS